MKQTLAERFWAKVDKRGPGECWLWIGARKRTGYGAISRGRLVVYAHRVSWELANGASPGVAAVLHRCDNPACCNPAHLFLGTIADNSRDCVSKGRQARGEKNGRSKLTEAAVSSIWAWYEAGVPFADMAARLGVHRTTAYFVISGRTWRHVSRQHDARAVAPHVAATVPGANSTSASSNI